MYESSSTGGEYLSDYRHLDSENSYEVLGPHDSGSQVRPTSNPDDGFAPPDSAYILPLPFDAVVSRTPAGTQMQEHDPPSASQSSAAPHSLAKSIPSKAGFNESSKGFHDVSTSGYGAMPDHDETNPWNKAFDYRGEELPAACPSSHGFRAEGRDGNQALVGGLHMGNSGQVSYPHNANRTTFTDFTESRVSSNVGVGRNERPSFQFDQWGDSAGSVVSSSVREGRNERWSFQSDQWGDSAGSVVSSSVGEGRNEGSSFHSDRWDSTESVVSSSVGDGRIEKPSVHSDHWGGSSHERDEPGWRWNQKPLQGLRAPLAQGHSNLAEGTHGPVLHQRGPGPGPSPGAGISGMYRPGPPTAASGVRPFAGSVKNSPPDLSARKLASLFSGTEMPLGGGTAKEQLSWGRSLVQDRGISREPEGFRVGMGGPGIHRPPWDVSAERPAGKVRVIGPEAHGHAAGLARHAVVPKLPAGFPSFAPRSQVVAPNSEMGRSAGGLRLPVPAEVRNVENTRTSSRDENESDFDILSKALGFDEI